MNGWQEVEASCIRGDKTLSVVVKIPPQSSNDEIWRRCREAMLYAHYKETHGDVTCWRHLINNDI